MKNRIKCLLISAALAGMTVRGMAQSNLYVATTGDDAANSGQSWDSPYATISNGIAHASTAGDTVWVSNGIYTLSATLSISRAITVSAWSASAADTTIDGDGTVRCVSISAAATLSRFTITNGYIVGSQGAGVYMTAAGTVTGCVIVNNTLNYTNNGANGYGGGGVYLTVGTVQNCDIMDNRAYDSAGGGVCNRGGTVMVCTVVGNIATNGGGVYMYGGAVQGCTIRANQANNRTDGTSGGGGGVMVYTAGTVRDSTIEKNTNSCTIYTTHGGGLNLNGAVLVTNCTISENFAGYGGGGVMTRGSTAPYARIVDSVISNNNASQRGGGVFINEYGVLDRCTIIGNKTGERGAGVYCDRGGQIRNCLFVANSNAGSYGGGLMLENTKLRGGYLSACTIVSNYISNTSRGGGVDINDWDYGATPTNCFITNCIVYFNKTKDVYPTTAAVLSNYWYSCTTTVLPAEQGNITNNPQFVDKEAVNYRLAKGSACINAGTNDTWMTDAVDRDRRLRIRYGRADMGAYEVIYNAFMFTVY